MSVEKRKWRDRKTGATKEAWQVRIDLQLPDGTQKRVRKQSQGFSKRAAEAWERRARDELARGTFGRKEASEIPTLEEFCPRFIEDWCRANKQKPSGIDSKESAFRNYLMPLFAQRRLNTFGPADEDKLKRSLVGNAASTYNNAASAMNVALTVAARWKDIEHIPHRFQLLKRQKGVPKFYDFDQYEWLVDAARRIDRRIYILVLLGGDAGLRRGEIIALDQAAVDLRRGLLAIEWSEWKGQVTETKGMKARSIPMTDRLRAALAEHRHLRGPRVLYTDAGEKVTAKVLQKWMAQAQKLASLRDTGGLHILRHTFCSHLAMRGAPAIAIQRLAGHEDLATTMMYMHLAPGEADRAIRLLDEHRNGTLTAHGGDAERNSAQ